MPSDLETREHATYLEAVMQDGYPLGETDARHLAIIASARFAKAHMPTWAYTSRICMTMLLYSSLEQVGGEPYPTTTITIRELSMAARCKYQLAWDFMRWMLDEGHIVRVTRADGTKALAFSWHIAKAGDDDAER